MCYFLRKCIEKVTPSRFGGEVSASTVPLGPHTSHALTLLGLHPSQREHTPATPVLCPRVRSLLHGHPPCLSPRSLPTSLWAPGSSHLPLHTLLHTVLQTRRDFVSPYLISCTVWDSTLLENLQWFPVVQKKKKQTSTPLQFPGPCHLSTSLPHLIWHHCLHLTRGLCVFTCFLLPDSPPPLPPGPPILGHRAGSGLYLWSRCKGQPLSTPSPLLLTSSHRTGFVWSPEPGWACAIQPPSPPGKLCLQVISSVCSLFLRLPTTAFSGLYLKLDFLSLLDFSCRNNQRHQKYRDFTCPFTVPAPTLWEHLESCGTFFTGIGGTEVRHRHHEAQGRKP